MLQVVQATVGPDNAKHAMEVVVVIVDYESQVYIVMVGVRAVAIIVVVTCDDDTYVVVVMDVVEMLAMVLVVDVDIEDQVVIMIVMCV